MMVEEAQGGPEEGLTALRQMTNSTAINEDSMPWREQIVSGGLWKIKYFQIIHFLSNSQKMNEMYVT